MKTEEAQKWRDIYRKNEDRNDHSANLVLLASLYGDKTIVRAALMNLKRRDRKHESDMRLNNFVGILCCGFYSKLMHGEELQSLSAREQFNGWHGLNPPPYEEKFA